MIITKPKIGTLFSLGIFIFACFSISGYTLSLMLTSGVVIWYQYLIVLILSPLALGLLVKVILGYKRIEIGKGRITIKYPTRFSEKNYGLNEIDYWTEQKVKTGASTFKELNVRFTGGKKLALSLQEHSHYLDVIEYLRKKCPKKFVERK